MTTPDSRSPFAGWTGEITSRRDWMIRIESQLRFAGAISELEPASRRKGWKKALSEAHKMLDDAHTSGRLDDLPDVAEQIEQALSPMAAIAKEYTMHCIGHAHIDMNWQWGWPETVATTRDSLGTVLKLMDEFPEFRFLQSQTSVYEIARRYCPDVFEGIRQRVKEGRWEVAASTWVEGERNTVTGEALGRHYLYTRRWMAEHLGLSPEDVKLDWEPDAFGHAASIPGILNGGGVTRYYCCRPGQPTPPPVFWWIGSDGSRVLVNREWTWYNDTVRPASVDAFARFCKVTGLRDWLYVFGVGDHGGGPTRQDLLRIREMNNWPIYPTLRFGSTDEWYSLLEAEGSRWEEITGELNFEFPGCYTSQSRIKRTNRQSEHLCMEAEQAATLHWAVSGAGYPSGRLAEAWQRTLLGHFHDILPGSGVAETREYHLGEFQHVVADTDTVKTRALRALACQVDKSFAPAGCEEHDRALWYRNATGGGLGAGAVSDPGEMSTGPHGVDWPRAVVAFNPVGHARSGLAVVPLWEGGLWPSVKNMEDATFVARLPDGTTVPAQRVGEGSWLAHRYVTVALPLKAGAMGYTSAAIEPIGEFDRTAPDNYPRRPMTPDVEGFTPAVTAGPDWLENEHLRVEFDTLTGGITKLLDKHSGRDLAPDSEPTALLEYVVERPGAMSSWRIHPLKERHSPLTVTRFGPAPLPGKRLQTPAKGPHVAVLAAEIPVERSVATVSFVLSAESRSLEVHLAIRWLETGDAEKGIPGLRLALPMNLRKATASYEIPFGQVERDERDGEEVPALRWANVTGEPARGTGGSAGLAVLNAGQSGHSLDGSTLRVNLIRSSYEPDPLPELGDHEMRLALQPHDGSLTAADLTRAAEAFHHRLQVVTSDGEANRENPLPAEATAVSKVTPASVVLTGIKVAEDGEGAILRLMNPSTRKATARVTLNADLLGAFDTAAAVDLLERPIDEPAASLRNGAVSVAIAAGGIASVKLTRT
jgi:alpha-mannosidase